MWSPIQLATATREVGVFYDEETKETNAIVEAAEEVVEDLLPHHSSKIVEKDNEADTHDADSFTNFLDLAFDRIEILYDGRR